MAEPRRWLPDLLRAAKETPVQPKDYIALETTRLVEDHATRRHGMTQAFVLGLVASGVSFGFACLGVVLVALGGDDTHSTVDMFGASIETDSVGVAAVFFGAATFVVSLRAVLQVTGAALRIGDSSQDGG